MSLFHPDALLWDTYTSVSLIIAPPATEALQRSGAEMQVLEGLYALTQFHLSKGGKALGVYHPTKRCTLFLGVYMGL